jgi:YidC/Oxa1 family membrane protein insertase
VLSHQLLAENSLFKVIGQIFHPVFELFGWILAGLYAVWPNYGFAIAGLTVIIMLALTPVTVKSTKSMLAMQRLQPEMKKLQAKYKGPENREMLNQEMMRLYKENGTSPFGACLPMFLQMPFLIVLYDLIRGLSNTVSRGAAYVNASGQKAVCHAATCGSPRYVPTNSQIHQSLVESTGQMHWWFGMDLSKSPWPFASHGFPGILPYLGLIAAAMILQYYQMRQMNSRNPQAAAANPQMQTMQKFFPFLFGLIYLKVPAGATIYMVVSSAMRIATQEVMFRTGMVTPVAAEREIGAVKEEKESPPPKPAKLAKPTKTRSTATDGTAVAKGTLPPAKSGSGGNGGSPSRTNGRNQTNGRKPAAKRPSNGKSSSSKADEPPGPKAHPRSRSKRTRKAR